MADFYEDTIAAAATAMTPSGIGIVRISGKDAFSVADRVYRGATNKKLADQRGNTIHYGFIVDQGQLVDEVLVMLMKAPHSYTGENTVEIDCHGSVLAMKKVLDAVLKSGARPAEQGEFTKRAFLNGRLDLSQAEAVMDVISAKNDYALKNALSQMSGSVARSIREIREKLIYEIAYIESALDDPEQISLTGYSDSLNRVIGEQKKKLEKLLSTFDQGKMIREGIKTLILGKPNSGKSSLMNLLVGKEKAIVTEIAGTTRDVLEENINIQGITLQILDTAGIRETSNIVEQIGIEHAKSHASNADLILYVVDSSIPLDDNDSQILDIIRNKKTIILLNKNDLVPKVTGTMLEKLTQFPVISISAKNNIGIDRLEELIKTLFFQGDIAFNNDIYITNIRHKKILEIALEKLIFVENSIAKKMSEDFYSIDLMGAYEALGSILGESLGEDLINEIFSKFCTGK